MIVINFFISASPLEKVIDGKKQSGVSPTAHGK